MDDEELTTYMVTFTAVVDAPDRATAEDEARAMIGNDRHFEADRIEEFDA